MPRTWNATYQYEPDDVTEPITVIHAESFSAPSGPDATEAARRFAKACPSLVAGANYVELTDAANPQLFTGASL